MRRKRILPLLPLFLATSVLATDQPSAVLPKPIVLRLDGHFAPDRKQASAEGADAVSIRTDDVERWFSAVRSRTIGDHPLDGREVLAMLAPIQPNLIAVGSDDLKVRLRTAPAGMPLEIEGLLERGSRTLLLRRVAVGSPPEP